MIPTEKGTYFVNQIPQQRNREFKMVVGMKPESDPIPCKVIATELGKFMIEYQDGNGTSMKWISEDQLITI